MTTATPLYDEIERDAMPAFSFRYGQRADLLHVDAPIDAWLVCTPCSHFTDETTHVEVLVAHFIYSSEDDARTTAADLSRNHRVTLVRPETALASRRAPEHESVDDCTLVYQGHVAAPGYGVSYVCSSCERPWLKIGASFVDPREQLYELRPEDVV